MPKRELITYSIFLTISLILALSIMLTSVGSVQEVAAYIKRIGVAWIERSGNRTSNEADGDSYEVFAVADVSANAKPTVNAGEDRTITHPYSIPLEGSVSDDGIPNSPGMLVVMWSTVSGPGTVTFSNNHAVNSIATFSTEGIYVLQLTAGDGELVASDDVRIHVTGDGTAHSIEVPVAASPDDAEEQESGIDNDAVSFAVIGDYGNDSDNEARVANLVNSWNPDFVITTGDNNYPDGENTTIDDNIGKHYSQFIGDYQGFYGPGSTTNRFWPSLGNHDWQGITCSGDTCKGAYFDYFNLPNNERYYETDLGLVHLFVIDSDGDEPAGRNASSDQAEWLQNQLAASNDCYKIVYFHHPPFSSGRHGSNASMQWPFSTWGADAVLSGHDHLYERIEAYGIPYFVNGAGGASLYSFNNLGSLPSEATSVVRYNRDHGAMLVTATPNQITYQFYNVEDILIDDYTVAKDCYE